MRKELKDLDDIGKLAVEIGGSLGSAFGAILEFADLYRKLDRRITVLERMENIQRRRRAGRKQN